MIIKFSELTEEQLIEQIIEMNDPDIVGDEWTVNTFGHNKSEDEMFAVKLRGGIYLKADNLTWSYYDFDDHVELQWEEITQESYHELMLIELEAMTLNELRMEHRRAHYNQFLIQDRNQYKHMYEVNMAMVRTATALLERQQKRREGEDDEEEEIVE